MVPIAASARTYPGGTPTSHSVSPALPAGFSEAVVTVIAG